MTVVSMMSYSQTNKISQAGDNMENVPDLNSRKFEMPLDQWFTYGDATGLYIKTTPKKFDEAFDDAKSHYGLSDQPDLSVTYSNITTGEVEKVNGWSWTHDEGYDMMVIVSGDMIIVTFRQSIFYMW